MGYPDQGSAYNDVSGRYSLRSQIKDRENKSRALPFCSLDSVPTFVVDDHRVCKFIVCFTEEIPEYSNEPVRTRKAELSYFLEDDTIEIVEPRVSNSGLFQGKLMRRHQIVKPSSNSPGGSNPEVSIYNLLDLRAGTVLDLYKRSYKIVDCDEFTKKIFREMGEDFGQPIPIPPTYYDPSANRLTLATRRGASEIFSPAVKPFTAETKAFFEYGDIVLRFYGVWDDRNALFGVLKTVRIHYYLADHTLEILQDFSPNDGRDRNHSLMKRMKVPKGIFRNPNEPSLSYTMEDVYEPDQVYDWTDFKIGKHIYVAGIEILIVDADKATRSFCVKKNRPLDPPIVMKQDPPPRVELIIPPHNGFGSEEDSIQTCLGKITPSPPRKDLVKAKAFSGQVLRFRAKLLSNLSADRERTFVVQLHLEDDTIQIREPPARNSGFWGGMFMTRTKIKRSDGSYVTPGDLVVGANLTVNGHTFVLEEADEFSLKFMESRSQDLWPMCSLKAVLGKLHSNEGAVLRNLLTVPGGATKSLLHEELERLILRSGVILHRQELLTLLRGLDRQRKGTVKVSSLVTLLQSESGGNASDGNQAV